MDVAVNNTAKKVKPAPDQLGKIETPFVKAEGTGRLAQAVRQTVKANRQRAGKAG